MDYILRDIARLPLRSRILVDTGKFAVDSFVGRGIPQKSHKKIIVQRVIKIYFFLVLLFWNLELASILFNCFLFANCFFVFLVIVI